MTRDEIRRRRFLGYLLGGPLAGALAPGARAQVLAQAGAISNLGQVQNVLDLQAVAARTIRPAHYGYLQTGVLDDQTMEANRRAYSAWGIEARRMVDVSKIDLSVKLFGETYASPIALAPVSAQRAFHQDGERPAARAAHARNALQMLSTLTTVSVETVISDRQGPVWFQLYPTSDADIARTLVRRADKAGANAIVLTVDLLAGGMRRETQAALARQDTGNCQQCHDRAGGFPDLVRRKAMFDGIDVSRAAFDNPRLTWDYVGRLREWTQRPVLVKGVMSAEDAERALAAGAQGIIVSNHGGRAEESLVAPLSVLPEIVEKVGGRAPVLIDGGLRRGPDVFKALALGATAAGVGRPYIWGLAAFGQAGVEAALRLMEQELASAMQQAGVTRLADIRRSHLRKLD